MAYTENLITIQQQSEQSFAAFSFTFLANINAKEFIYAKRKGKVIYD